MKDLLQLLEKYSIKPRIEDWLDLATRGRVLLLEHLPSGVPIDLIFVVLPFELEAIEHSIKVDFQGMCLPFPRPEDLLIYKLVASRPRDLDDAEKLLLLHEKSDQSPSSTKSDHGILRCIGRQNLYDEL